MAAALLLLPAAYLAGSVNFSILLFRARGRGDPRAGFSGNPGTFNVSRQVGAGWAALILALDLGRAVGVAAAARALGPRGMVPWAGFFLVLGNMFPLFHGFRGGKGVAAFLGLTAYAAPAAAALSALAWIIVYRLIARVTFIASSVMVAVLAAGTVAAFGGAPLPAAGTLATAAAVMAAHRRNVREYLRQRSDGNRGERGGGTAVRGDGP